jgi:hypothetical protein
VYKQLADGVIVMPAHYMRSEEMKEGNDSAKLATLIKKGTDRMLKMKKSSGGQGRKTHYILILMNRSQKTNLGKESRMKRNRMKWKPVQTVVL